MSLGLITLIDFCCSIDTPTPPDTCAHNPSIFSWGAFKAGEEICECGKSMERILKVFFLFVARARILFVSIGSLWLQRASAFKKERRELKQKRFFHPLIHSVFCLSFSFSLRHTHSFSLSPAHDFHSILPLFHNAKFCCCCE